MATYQEVRTGLQLFLEQELLQKLTGIQKWIVGAGASIAMDKADHIFNSLKDNGIVKALEIMDQNGNIDVEMLYKALMQQAQKTDATISIPMIGTITLHQTDVDLLHDYIRQAM